MKSNLRLLPVAGAAVLAAALTGCAGPDPYGPNNYPVSQAPATSPSTAYPAPAGTYTQPVAAVEYGRVTDVRLISGPPVASNGRSAAGTVIGAIVGGVLGNRIGGGAGRAAATVLGAVGGAAAGNAIANNGVPHYAANQTVYRVAVQTDSGEMRTYDVSATGDLRPGDRVRVENGVIYRA